MDTVQHLNAALAGRYEIEREIGRGGMATVYLARDLRHERQVALKLLDPELGAVLGADRFLSEIRVTATLQHPNLLPLFDSGAADGLLFYVMPYVDGESLRARLNREKQLPIDDAIRLATAVAGALDYAHRHGVIHRDLKPENILLHDGQPVVADFGIALAVSKAGGARVTQTGISLGTPQYMSPEQATGDRAIDGRTDIYSLGAVTYEMLTGEAPHVGNTAQAIMAKLMTEEPRPLTVLRRAVPVQVDYAVRRALEKLPADRFATAREFAEALEGKGPVVTAMPARVAASLVPLAVACVTAAAFAIAAGLAWAKVRQKPELEPLRFKLDLPVGQRFEDAEGASVAISPDGRTIAYLARADQHPRAIFVRRLDELQSHALPGTENAQHLSFSRDGRWISFLGEGDRLSQVSVAGGAPSLFALVPKWEGNGWGANNEIVYSSEGSIRLLRRPGGLSVLVARPDASKGEADFAGPFVLPDSDHVVFAIARSQATNSPSSTPSPPPVYWEMGIVSLAKPTPAPILTRTSPSDSGALSGSAFGYVGGWLIYGRADQTIAAIKFDPRRARTTGEPVTLLEGALWKTNGGIAATLSASGSLIYVRGATGSFLSLLDARGSVLTTAGEDRSYSAPTWSPDGKRVAVEVHTSSKGIGSAIWIYDVASHVFTRITSRVPAEHPSWTADGKRIAFINADDPKGASVWSVPADNSGPEEPFFLIPGRSLAEIAFSADDHHAVLRTDPDKDHSTASLWLLPLQGERKAVPFVQTPFHAAFPAVSPNSKWVAYESNPNGRAEIYLKAISGFPGVVQVSSGGGTEPRWLPDGRLAYRDGRAFRSATLSEGPGAPTILRRDSLFADSYRLDAEFNRQNYDIARDGRFVVVRNATEGGDIIVVSNWLTEVRAKLRGK